MSKPPLTWPRFLRLRAHLLGAIITCILTIAATAPLHADPQGELYFLPNNNGVLYRLNLENGVLESTTSVMNSGTSNYAGLASIGLDPVLISGRLGSYEGSYFWTLNLEPPVSAEPFPFTGQPAAGLAFDPETSTLYRSTDNVISAFTGPTAVSLPLPYGGFDAFGLAWGQGGLFALEYNDESLWFFDPTTQEWSSRGLTGIGNWNYCGLAYSPDSDLLYATRPNSLYSIDPNTAESTQLGSLNNISQNPSGGGLAWIPADCDENGIPDYEDVANGATDCNGNQVPDVCEPDCDGDGILDECAITTGTSADCDDNGVPDECDVDCDGNGLVDQCELNGGLAQDCDGNGIINACEPDCDGNGFADACELLGGLASDCDGNGVIDSCDEDCDGNGFADACEVLAGTAFDCDGNGVIDLCETDCDGNGIADVCQGRIFQISNPGITVPCCATYIDELIIGNPGFIEDVDVSVQLTGAWESNTRISVTSPSGTALSNLHNAIGGSSNLVRSWSDTREPDRYVPDLFSGSMTVWVGESAAGAWSMTVDRIGSNGGSGTWNEWGLSLLTDAMPLDCDEDGIPDSCEADCDANGIPDDCDVGNGVHRPYQSSLATPVVIDNSAPVIETILVTDDVPVGDLDAFVHYQHDSACELQIKLTSPGGIELILKDFGDSCDAVQNRSRFSDQGESGYTLPLDALAALKGTSIVGEWTLTLSQGAVAPTGQLYAWAILNQVGGEGIDCDANGVPDSCDISAGDQIDCDGNGVPDVCEILGDGSLDCDISGVLDSCEIAADPILDCDQSGVLDSCELFSGTLLDCNLNNSPDVCDISGSTSGDCNSNLIPDECEISSEQYPNEPLEYETTTGSLTVNYPNTYTDTITIQDSYLIEDLDVLVEASIAWSAGLRVIVASESGTSRILHNYTGSSNTYNTRTYDDEGGTLPYQPLSAFDGQSIQGTWTMTMISNHSNTNGIWYSWSLLTSQSVGGFLGDCNGNGVLDECEILSGVLDDCDLDGIPDDCQVQAGIAHDCNGNGVLDVCDIIDGTSPDCDQNYIPDECGIGSEIADCNLNGVPDTCDLTVNFTSIDCDEDGVPDECQVFDGVALDCDGNGVLDSCELSIGDDHYFDIQPAMPITFFNSPSQSISEIVIDTPGVVYEVSVVVDITHPATEELTLELLHPTVNSSETTVLLYAGGGGAGADFVGTQFDMSSGVPINDGAAPFTGVYLPIGNLNQFASHDMSGSWKLRILDDGFVNDGILNSWGLIITPQVLNDCNSNGVLDRCESDCNGNLVPDECETTQQDFVLLTEFFESVGGNYSNPLDFEIYVDQSIQLADVGILFNDLNINSNYDVVRVTPPDGISRTLSFSSSPPPDDWFEYGCMGDPIEPATACLNSFGYTGPAQGIWKLRLTVTQSNGGSFSLSGWGIHGLTEGAQNDCNDNDIPDDCDIANGDAFDCNGNGILDSCDALDGTAFDCNGNGIADSCEYGPATDCNANGILDECDVLAGIEGDCNGDGLLDSCEVAAGASDCDGNQIPDDCQPDCDGNGTADPCDIASGAGDCDGDGVLDSCESDCNANGTPDDCDIAAGTSEDCDDNGIPDECQLIEGFVDCDGNGLIDVCQLFVEPDLDCDGNGAIDICELLDGTAADCDGNGIIDLCDILAGVGDCDFDGVPDPCEPEDCDGDGVPDACAIATGLVPDCDGDELPDSCSISQGSASDCDGNGVPDICTLLAGLDTDCDFDGVLDSCAIASGTPDCDGDAVPDSCAISAGTVSDCNGNDIPDSCDIASGSATDADGDGVPDLCDGAHFLRAECNGDGTISIADPVFLLDYLFSAGTAPGCSDGCDGNDDGGIDLSDVVFSLDYLFSGGAPPPPPWPQCGPDPSDDSLNCATAPDCL